MTKGLRIGQVSRQVGIPTQTIRYYERLGLLNEPLRTESHYRLNTEADLARLQFIRKAKLFNLTLDEIRQMIVLSGEGLSPCNRLAVLVKRHLDGWSSASKKRLVFGRN